MFRQFAITFSRILPFAAATICAAAETVPTLQWKPLLEPGAGGWVTSLGASPHQNNMVLIGGDLLGIGRSENGGDSWRDATGLPSWEIGQFTFHPSDAQIVWAGTLSGPAISRDSGRTWRLSRDGMMPIDPSAYSAPIEQILIDRENPNRLLAFGGSFRGWEGLSPLKGLGIVWESTNAGTSWQKISMITNAKGAGINILTATFAAKSSAVLLVATRDAGIQMSTDGGKTWSPSSEGLPHLRTRVVAAHPDNPLVFWAALDNFQTEDKKILPGGIYKSTDGGKTWRQSDSGIHVKPGGNRNTSTNIYTMAVSPVNPQILLASDFSWQTSAIYYSHDGGSNWEKSETPTHLAYPSSVNMSFISCDPVDPQIAYAGSAEHILRTRDGGRTWQDIASTYEPSSQTWRGTGYSGLCATAATFDPENPNHLVILGWDHANFFQSTDGARSWRWGGKGMPAWGGAREVAFMKPQTIFVTLGQGNHPNFTGIARSTDNGQTWELLAGKERGLPNAGEKTQPMSVLVPTRHPTHVLVTIGGKLYQSRDRGNTWVVLHEGPSLRWISEARDGSGVIFISGPEGIYRSEQIGLFSMIPKSPKDAAHITAVSSRHVLAAVHRRSPGGLLEWKNGEWKCLRDDDAIINVAVSPADSNRMIAVTMDPPFRDISHATGVWITADGGATWSQQNNGLRLLRAEAATFNPHDPEQIILGSHGAGFYVARWPR